jgi:hypothetical protein
MIKVWQEGDFVISFNNQRNPRWLVTCGTKTITEAAKRLFIAKYAARMAKEASTAKMNTSILKLGATPPDTYLDSCTATSKPCYCDVAQPIAPACNKQKEKGTTMYLDSKVDLDVQTKTRLLDSLTGSEAQKNEELRALYGLTDDEAPRSWNELVERISAGRFMIPEDRKAKIGYSPLLYVRWRDPAKKEDCDGFEKAEKLLYTAAERAKDAIMALPAPEGLKVLQEFQDKSFS